MRVKVLADSCLTCPYEFQGRVFYVDHNTRQTTWMRPSPMKQIEAKAGAAPSLPEEVPSSKRASPRRSKRRPHQQSQAATPATQGVDMSWLDEYLERSNASPRCDQRRKLNRNGKKKRKLRRGQRNSEHRRRHERERQHLEMLVRQELAKPEDGSDVILDGEGALKAGRTKVSRLRRLLKRISMRIETGAVADGKMPAKG